MFETEISTGCPWMYLNTYSLAITLRVSRLLYSYWRTTSSNTTKTFCRPLACCRVERERPLLLHHCVARTSSVRRAVQERPTNLHVQKHIPAFYKDPDFQRKPRCSRLNQNVAPKLFLLPDTSRLLHSVKKHHFVTENILFYFLIQVKVK